MSEDKWGAGDPLKWKYLEEKNQFQDGTSFRLFFGEHPHSRSDRNIYADLGRGEPVGFDGHRVRTKIVLEEANYMKCSGLSGNEIRKQCWADIFMNDKMVYRVDNRRSALPMLLVVHDVIGRLMEHPVQLWRPDWDELIGRKVFYHGHPAKVIGYLAEQGCVILNSADERPFPKMPWHESEETSAKDDFLSDHIWWFRKDED